MGEPGPEAGFFDLAVIVPSTILYWLSRGRWSVRSLPMVRVYNLKGTQLHSSSLEPVSVSPRPRLPQHTAHQDKQSVYFPSPLGVLCLQVVPGADGWLLRSRLLDTTTKAGSLLCGGIYHSAMLLWIRDTEVSISIGWYRSPLSSSVSSRAPTTYKASWRSDRKKKKFGSLDTYWVWYNVGGKSTRFRQSAPSPGPIIHQLCYFGQIT